MMLVCNGFCVLFGWLPIEKAAGRIADGYSIFAKNLTTHLTHKLCAVLPWKSLIVYAVMNVVPVSSYLATCVSITPSPNRIYT